MSNKNLIIFFTFAVISAITVNYYANKRLDKAHKYMDQIDENLIKGRYSGDDIEKVRILLDEVKTGKIVFYFWRSVKSFYKDLL